MFVVDIEGLNTISYPSESLCLLYIMDNSAYKDLFMWH